MLGTDIRGIIAEEEEVQRYRHDDRDQREGGPLQQVVAAPHPCRTSRLATSIAGVRARDWWSLRGRRPHPGRRSAGRPDDRRAAQAQSLGKGLRYCNLRR